MEKSRRLSPSVLNPSISRSKRVSTWAVNESLRIATLSLNSLARTQNSTIARFSSMQSQTSRSTIRTRPKSSLISQDSRCLICRATHCLCCPWSCCQNREVLCPRCRTDKDTSTAQSPCRSLTRTGAWSKEVNGWWRGLSRSFKRDTFACPTATSTKMCPISIATSTKTCQFNWKCRVITLKCFTI